MWKGIPSIRPTEAYSLAYYAYVRMQQLRESHTSTDVCQAISKSLLTVRPHRCTDTGVPSLWSSRSSASPPETCSMSREPSALGRSLSLLLDRLSDRFIGFQFCSGSAAWKHGGGHVTTLNYVENEQLKLVLCELPCRRAVWTPFDAPSSG